MSDNIKLSETSHELQLSRLNKIEGQVRGIKKMIQDKRYCMDILIQLKSTISALKKVRNNVLKGHLLGCINCGLINSNQEAAEEKIKELANLLDSMV
jgi:DNA-binding FrmR family transcriptional regulator